MNTWAFGFRLSALGFFGALLAACTAKRLDPPTYFHDSARVASVAALLHARDVAGVSYHMLDTHSMEPLLVGGDFIVAAPTPFAQLKLGQVIVYRAAWLPAGAPPVVHRLVEQDRHGWILSGDNNGRSEPQHRVTATNYLGLVVGIYTTRRSTP